MKRHMKFRKGLSAFIFVLFIVITLSTLKVEASEAGVNSKDLDTGEYNSTLVHGGLQIKGTQYQKFQVVELPNKLTSGEYSFTKGIHFSTGGNTNYYCIACNVPQKVKSVYIFATSPSEEPVEVVLRTVNEDRIATAIIGNMNNNEVAKIELAIPTYGNYYIYTTGEAYILGVYFGGISDAEKIALGKQIENTTPYYLLVEQYTKEEREPVFLYAALVFLVSFLVFILVIRRHKGKHALEQVVRETPRKKVDNTVYKE